MLGRIHTKFLRAGRHLASQRLSQPRPFVNSRRRALVSV